MGSQVWFHVALCALFSVFGMKLAMENALLCTYGLSSLC